MEEILTIEQLSFTYPEQKKAALQNVNLTVRRGEFFVLCGYSGSGKSTLLRHLKPALTPHGTCSGTVYYNGVPLEELDAQTAASKIGFVLQSPEHQIVTDKVWHELAFGLESLGLDTPTIRRRTAEMAAFFGIENWYYKNVSDLSGGQKQLLSLASIMAMQPELLILDEPTAQLDPIAASEFLATLYKINRELGTTVVLSEHRLEEALAYASRAAVMDQGRICTTGTVEEVGQYLRRENSAMFSAMPAAMRVWGSVDCDLPCPVTVNDGRTFLRSYAQTHPSKSLEKETADRGFGEEQVRVREAWFRYEKDLPDTVKGLDLSARAGELLCILGGNGSGKTTTLRLLSGIRTPYRGEIQINGTVGYLPQDPQTVFVKKTVYEDLADVPNLKKAAAEERDRQIAGAASLCEIGELLDRHPYDLSGGEQQRAALAKVLLTAPEILLLDEPTKGLDVPFKEILAGILQRLKNSGVCIIMVSHDVEFCAQYGDTCGLFFDGHIVTAAPPRAFFAGNSFYTTAANRMARETEPAAVTVQDVISVIGGTMPACPVTEECAPSFAVLPKEEKAAKKLPLWRKIGAAVSGALAFGVFLYSAKAENLSKFIDKNGMTALGKNQLLWYGAFILLLSLVAVFLGRRGKPPVQVQTPAQKRKISKRTTVAAVLILLLIPLTLFAGLIYIEKKQYYITALAVLIECMAPFFLVFEGRKPKARELVLIATLCALAVAGRAAFFVLPQFKPVMALTIIAGVALGGETGFLVGALTMLVSNILFSQGPWTPWQMFAMGIIGFLAGVLYKKGWLLRSRGSLCVFGGICAFLIYGGIMNPASALIWGSETLNLKILLGYYISGFPMDAVHAASTVLFLWFGAQPMLEKLDRIKVKYGLVE